MVIMTIRAGIITASDRGARGEREDQSGPAIAEVLGRIGAKVEEYDVIPDEPEIIVERLVEMADQRRLDLVLTAGGTGLGPRDNTPDATLRVIHREVPGIAERMRQVGFTHTPRAMLSRATAGVRARTLIINLPGSPKAACECLEAVLPALEHAVAVLRGEVKDCARE